MVDKRLIKKIEHLLLVLLVVSLTASAASASTASKTVSLSYLQVAATSDPARSQGGTTPGATDSVKIVEAALVEEGYLDDAYAYDGAYGSATIKAYKKWQESLGSAAKYCDGIPGKRDLTKLGNKYGFTVDTSTVSDFYLFDSEEDTTKLNAPVADFSASTTYGDTPLKVRFTDESTGSPTKWKWTFGDGSSSEDTDPRHTYSRPGKYTVTLKATNEAGSDTEKKSKYIIVTEGEQDLSLTASAASAAKVVSLPALQRAAAQDPYGYPGTTTSGAIDSVEIVEEALLEEGYLSEFTAYDGSYDLGTIEAYKKWQESLGSPAKYCDGIPGKKDLTKLGNKYGFTVDVSTVADSSASSKTETKKIDTKKTEKELNVPVFLQTDSKWSGYKLGNTKKGNTIGSAGCAITSISMVFKYYGVQTDPKALNTWLLGHNGYNGGDVDWTRAPGISNGKVKFISPIDYAHIPADLNKIKSELDSGHPVIATVKSKSGKYGYYHYIVVTGYSGSTYYINDPSFGKRELSYYNKDPAKAICGIWIYH